MPVILAIDTATGPCSVALWDGRQVACYLEEPSPVRQSARLLPMVEDALKQSGIAYRDLTHVAATVGPGSFTGIRVGLAAARAIAFASGTGALGFTTLQVLAAAAGQSGDVLSILNAGKGEWYHQRFNADLQPLAAPAVDPLEHILQAHRGQPLMVSGNAAIEAAGFGHCGVTFPRADALALLAAGSKESLPLQPFYIRPPDAKLPVK